MPLVSNRTTIFIFVFGGEGGGSFILKRTEFERKSPTWSIRNSAGAVASNCLWWSSFVDTICKVMGVIRLIGVVAIRITFILPIDTHSFAARCST